MNQNNVIFIIGSMRSGKTLLKNLLMKVCPNGTNLTDDDSECRTFWQAFGLHIGARSTGTYCLAASREDVQNKHRKIIREHIEKRCLNGNIVINDNAHLMNKIGYIAEVLPEAKFIHVVRDIMGMVEATKNGFIHGNTNNESYPPFIHYWPDCKLPCWYTLRNDLHKRWPTLGSLRRNAREVCYRIWVKKKQLFTSYSQIIAHEKLSEFLKKHPDATRYYPGEGFGRLPEAWLIQNRNIIRQLLQLEKNRWIGVTYQDIVCNTIDTVRKTLDFIGCNINRLETIPEHLNLNYMHKWKDELRDIEQKYIYEVIQTKKDDFHLICDAFQKDHTNASLLFYKGNYQ